MQINGSSGIPVYRDEGKGFTYYIYLTILAEFMVFFSGGNIIAAQQLLAPVPEKPKLRSRLPNGIKRQESYGMRGGGETDLVLAQAKSPYSCYYYFTMTGSRV
jgi:hypothetical protein